MFNIFCKHQWEIKIDKVTESKFERTVKLFSDGNMKNTTIPWQMCDATRNHIVIMCCSKCGKIKKFETEI